MVRRVRARDLGIRIGDGTPGAHNAITDVRGVRVGHTTLVEGDGPLVVGRGPVRTGVTFVMPHDGTVGEEPLFAGCHTLNGNGELTGLEWVRESGMLTSPSAGPVSEGAVGGGTGMICHDFKGGIGTSSRVLSGWHGGFTVGILVQ